MLYPLRFQPVLKHYLWGGTQLRERFNKTVPAEMTCAESWELVDRRTPGGLAEQSVVRFGPLEGTPLAELVDRQGQALLGRHAPVERFPLLVKILDAEQTLSVQVHPDDLLGRQLTPPDLGKTEAWVVLHAQPGALVYAGLRSGTTRSELEDEIARGSVENCLHQFQPSAGDCIFIPAGMVHALGAGLLVAEIQQSSDTTFRLFDWNRLGPDGRPRELHIAQGIMATNDQLGPGVPVAPRATADPHLQQLVHCDKFVLNRWSISQPAVIGGDDRAHILMVVEGSVRIDGDPSAQPVTTGETVLIPASLGSTSVHPAGSAVLLGAHLP